jgi:hypothetical protein
MLPMPTAALPRELNWYVDGCTSDANSPDNSWRAQDIETVSDQRLVSPVIAIPAGASLADGWNIDDVLIQACVPITNKDILFSDGFEAIP